MLFLIPSRKDSTQHLQGGHHLPKLERDSTATFGSLIVLRDLLPVDNIPADPEARPSVDIKGSKEMQVCDHWYFVPLRKLWDKWRRTTSWRCTQVGDSGISGSSCIKDVDFISRSL